MKYKGLSILAGRGNVLRAALLIALCVALLCGCGPAPTETSSVTEPSPTPSISMYAPVDVAGALSISEKQLYLIKNQWPLRTAHIEDFGTLNSVDITTHDGATYLSFDFSKQASLDELYDQLSAYIDGTWEVTDSYFTSRDGKAEGISLQCSVYDITPGNDEDGCYVYFMFPFEEGNHALEVILEAHWPGEPFEVPELDGMVCSKGFYLVFYDAGGYRTGYINASGRWKLADEAQTCDRAYQAIVERMAATEGFVPQNGYSIVDGKKVIDPNYVSFRVGSVTVDVINNAGSVYVSYSGEIEQYWMVTGG